MSTARDQMFTNFIKAGADKPVLKCTDLDIGRIYPVVDIQKLTAGHKSVILISSDFKIFLPAAYKDVNVVEIEPTDKYGFSVEKIIKLSNGLHTFVMAFYNDGKKM